LTSDFSDVSETAEARAVAEAQKGSAEAFEFLYHAHKRRIYSLCLRMTGNQAEAEDLTQEAFLQVFRKISTFRGEAAFSTWMHRLAVNLVLMRHRKKGIPTLSLEEPIESDSGESRQRDVGAPDLALVGSVDRLTLERAIQALPDGYRKVFVLHDVEGYEHQEIAEMIGCSVGNSKSQLHKARMKLRDLLGGNAASRANGSELSDAAEGLEGAHSAKQDRE
jgi:RNA polymerase sigma-70 factor (ECF subfamily)